MKKYLLSSWLKISGIIAASGIGYENNQLYLVSDNSNALYHYFIENDSLASYSLDNLAINHQLKKKEKYDLESLLQYENTWYAFGSGSKKNRNKGFMINKFSKFSTEINLENLYTEMKSFAELTDKDLNIEAVCTYNDDFVFINRGNGPKNANYLFVVQGKNFIDEFNMYFFEFNLPKLNGVSTGFSDATIVNNTLFFVATVEDKNSTYEDGTVKGSLFGAIDLKKMKLLYTQPISNDYKFEGITVIKQDKKTIEFALCYDNDESNIKETTIYKLQVDLKNKIK